VKPQQPRVVVIVGLALAAGVAFSPGCQTGTGGGITELPADIVVWRDPDTGDTGTTVRDVNNDEERFIVVGTNGRVQFVAGGTVSVCNDCNTEGATIELGSGQLIDIRFGVGVVGDDTRRPFLVDHEFGEFIELVGGGAESITFQPTGQAFEEPDDPDDDLAQVAGQIENPTEQAASGGSGSTPLCGALGKLIPVVLGLLVLLGWRRR